MRRAIVPTPTSARRRRKLKESAAAPATPQCSPTESHNDCNDPPTAPLTWAQRLKRVFETDMLVHRAMHVRSARRLPLVAATNAGPRQPAQGAILDFCWKFTNGDGVNDLAAGLARQRDAAMFAERLRQRDR